MTLETFLKVDSTKEHILGLDVNKTDKTSLIKWTENFIDIYKLINPMIVLLVKEPNYLTPYELERFNKFSNEVVLKPSTDLISVVEYSYLIYTQQKLVCKMDDKEGLGTQLIIFAHSPPENKLNADKILLDIANIIESEDEFKIHIHAMEKAGEPQRLSRWLHFMDIKMKDLDLNCRQFDIFSYSSSVF